MNKEAIVEFLYYLADNQLILGHRNSEWTGLGPLLEEDIAFSSMAQDKIGHSLAFYEMLNELGEEKPDTIAFLRNPEEYKCCQMVELPNKNYAFSLIRHFLFDTAEMERMKILLNSESEEIAELAKKIKSELTYHTMHARTWVKKLGSATEDSIQRMQEALDECMPYARGMFEASPFEKDLKDMGFFTGERELEDRWFTEIKKILSDTQLEIGELTDYNPVYGGRIGKHTEFLAPLVEEMSEVLKIDPEAEW